MTPDRQWWQDTPEHLTPTTDPVLTGGRHRRPGHVPHFYTRHETPESLTAVTGAPYSRRFVVAVVVTVAFIVPAALVALVAVFQ